MLIDSPIILADAFQCCRWVKRISNRTYVGEVLAFASDILSIVEQQGKFLIDVPEGWVPEKWEKVLVNAYSNHGIEYTPTMKRSDYDYEPSDYDVFTPEKRREIALLRLLVRELQRLWAIGADVTVQLLGHVFHNASQWLRMPDEPGRDASMEHFRVISADWDWLSLEMREGCCRVVGLELHAAEALINTPGFSINTAGSKPRKL